MASPRIGDRDVARAGSNGTRRTLGHRFGEAVASPVGILLIVPGLVVAVGVLLTLLGQSALRDSTTTLGRDRFAEQTELLAHSVAANLAQTDPMLDRMGELSSRWSPDEPLGPVAHELRGVMNGRAGIAYASISYPDGTFQAAYLDDDGVIRFQHVQRTAEGAVMRRYDLVGIDEVVLRKEEPSQYDPRARGFYALAVASGRRVWTKPYVFFSSRHTGVTRTEPVFATDHSLRAVLTADYDVQALSLSMARTPLANARTLLYTPDGTILAFPEGAAAVMHLPAVNDRPLARARLVHERQSLLVELLSLVVALAVSFVFARHVVGARRAVLAATERAKELGSYRLVERLGEGGMGEVWRAEHRLLVRQAAIKLIRQEALRSVRHSATELRERFRREAQTLATLKSRHTIDLFDYGVTEDGTFFFVMELLDGMDLDTLVTKHGPLPAPRVIHLLLQACSSLAEAHDAGLVHRDVKPANVFVCRAADERDIVKVLDFGLVQGGDTPLSLPPVHTPPELAGRLTHDGTPMGTPAFMAPEQVLCREIDGRADLYALGCVAVWLLTGKEPFAGEGALAAMIAHVHQPVPELAGRVSGWFPPELDELIRRCLAKDPPDRPIDARALADELRQIAIPADEVWSAQRAHLWWDTHA